MRGSLYLKKETRNERFHSQNPRLFIAKKSKIRSSWLRLRARLSGRDSVQKRRGEAENCSEDTYEDILLMVMGDDCGFLGDWCCRREVGCRFQCRTFGENRGWRLCGEFFHLVTAV